MPAIPNGTPQANPAIDKNAKKDELNEKFSKFVRRIKLLFSSEGQGEQYLKVKMSRFPIEAVIVAGIVIIANGIYIGNYFVKKAHNTELENKVKTEWADVSAKKSDIESMAKVQKGVAPQTKYYETAIRLIVKSGVWYSQIHPSDTGMQVDVKGSPEQVSGLLANLKEAGISVLRSSLSFQTTSQQDGTILNQVTSSLTISPKQ